MRAALLAPDRFGTLLGIGLTMMMGIQAFVNMTVVTGLAPDQRHSAAAGQRRAGRRSLINLLAMGILLNISQQASATAATTVGDAP